MKTHSNSKRINNENSFQFKRINNENSFQFKISVPEKIKAEKIERKRAEKN
jgi:hypothetical protein